jgi:hypothetical protein
MGDCDSTTTVADGNSTDYLSSCNSNNTMNVNGDGPSQRHLHRRLNGSSASSPFTFRERSHSETSCALSLTANLYHDRDLTTPSQHPSLLPTNTSTNYLQCEPATADTKSTMPSPPQLSLHLASSAGRQLPETASLGVHGRQTGIRKSCKAQRRRLQ